MQIYDATTAGMHWQRQKVAAEHYRDLLRMAAAQGAQDKYGAGDKRAAQPGSPTRGLCALGWKRRWQTSQGLFWDIKGGALGWFVLPQHHMRVHATRAEGRNARDARERAALDDGAWPWAQLAIEHERTRRELDVGVGLLRMQGRHELPVAQGLYDVALDLRRIATLIPGVIERSCEDHVLIAEAIAAHDADAAVAAYRGHLDNIRDTTIRSLAEIKEVAIIEK